MKPKSKPVAKSFKATLERIPSRLNWVIIRIPFDVSKIWGTAQGPSQRRNQRFRVSLFRLPTSKGYHCMLVKRSMTDRRNAAPGKPRNSALLPDTAKRVAIVPAELNRILNEDRSFPPLVRPTQLFHAQVDLRLGHQCKKPRSPRPPAPNKSPNSCSLPWKPSSTCHPF